MTEKNRYNNTKIYKLVDSVNNCFYIGSTINSLAKRLYTHKRDSDIHRNIKVYKYFNSIGWENVRIILIEEHCLSNRDQQMRAEDNVIQAHINDEKCLNSNRAQQNRKEYRQSHKHQIYEYNKEYAKNHEQQIKNYMKNYWENNKELKEKKKIYYEKVKEKYTCIFGSITIKSNKLNHEKTIKHREFVKNQELQAQ